MLPNLKPFRSLANGRLDLAVCCVRHFFQDLNVVYFGAAWPPRQELLAEGQSCQS